MILFHPIVFDWRSLPESIETASWGETRSVSCCLPPSSRLAEAYGTMRQHGEKKAKAGARTLAAPDQPSEALGARRAQKREPGASSGSGSDPANFTKLRCEKKAEPHARREALQHIETKESGAPPRRNGGKRARRHGSLRSAFAALGEASQAAPPGKPRDLRLFLSCSALRRARSGREYSWLW